MTHSLSSELINVVLIQSYEKVNTSSTGNQNKYGFVYLPCYTYYITVILLFIYFSTEFTFIYSYWKHIAHCRQHHHHALTYFGAVFSVVHLCECYRPQFVNVSKRYPWNIECTYNMHPPGKRTQRLGSGKTQKQDSDRFTWNSVYNLSILMQCILYCIIRQL